MEKLLDFVAEDLPLRCRIQIICGVHSNSYGGIKQQRVQLHPYKEAKALGVFWYQTLRIFLLIKLIYLPLK
jgi:hypothetical protein